MTWLTEIRDDPGTRCNAVGLGANIGLTVLKFAVGTWTGSAALVADGFNSAGDIVATLIAFFGYRFAQEPPDENHHYGHGNADNIAGLVVGGILLATGVFVTLDGGRALLAGATKAPEALAIGAALLTAVIKEALYRYTTSVGNQVRSPALLASARDHRADVFLAVTVAGGVLGARLGLPWLDPLTACGIGVVIAAMAWEPIRVNFGVLMDEAPDGVRDAIFRVARSDDDVREAGAIRIHPVGGELVVDLEVYLDGTITLHRAHVVARRVEDAIRQALPQVRDVRANVKPTGQA